MARVAGSARKPSGSIDDTISRTKSPQAPAMTDSLQNSDEQHHLEELNTLSKRKLPQAYLTFLKDFQGAEHDLPILPYCAFLDSALEVIKNLKESTYELPPELIAIGSNGGEEVIVLDTRADPPRVASRPCIGFDYEDLYVVAKSFEDFLSLLDKQASDFSFEDELGREIILSNAQIARDAPVWTDQQIQQTIEKFNLEKFAPGYRPYAGIQNDEYSLLAIKESDGAVYKISCFGINYEPPNKLADSKEQLDEFLAMTLNNPPDLWRYPE